MGAVRHVHLHDEILRHSALSASFSEEKRKEGEREREK
jgi:hypothetical protein